MTGDRGFSGKKGEGLTIKQFELMVKGSLEQRFKKLQKDVGNPLEGAEFAGRYCIFLGEFLDNPARLAHEREYEAHCRTSDPVGALLASLRRHFEDHKEGKAHEWVQFRRESGEDLPSLLFRLQGLALDLGQPLGDQELVTKFVTCLDRRLAEQTNLQAMAGTAQAGGAYTLDEAYEAALRVTAMNARLKIAREQVPRISEASRARGGGRPVAALAAPAVVERRVRQPVSKVVAVDTEGLRIVSAAEFAEFLAWKAELQAIAAEGAGAGEGAEEEGSEYDDQEYELSSLALPEGRVMQVTCCGADMI
ncbi:hypothetical protein KFL_001850020 [Klebsormidium nitens]|uniref:Uncharacterized protein n=1 Tax=Klebsormidium nitens TaxID=105231 RepID=A0A1Y1I6I2_KLENI|nr:hypothetical protein KFL_001850020 [Klebsormidium nitens]|eukprot:GAQ84327.1 hypothetical protein KFL_001850020 [Klebsormidium nitens]